MSYYFIGDFSPRSQLIPIPGRRGGAMRTWQVGARMPADGEAPTTTPPPPAPHSGAHPPPPLGTHRQDHRCRTARTRQTILSGSRCRW
jgi:hypothetical protein